VPEGVRADYSLPIGSIGRKSMGWWGLLCLIATEGSLFAYLIFTYLYLAVQVGGNWRPEAPPSLSMGIAMTVLLMLNSLAMWWAERSISQNIRSQLVFAAGIGLLLVLGFMVLELLDWRSEPFFLRTSAYGASFFTLTGFHFAHCVAGAVMLALLIVWSLLDYVDRVRNVPVLVVSAYWHFTDAVWIVLFAVLFLAPHFE
jgi:heme/copper-type cytochrome/quinol oxidase subunit 3